MTELSARFVDTLIRAAREATDRARPKLPAKTRCCDACEKVRRVSAFVGDDKTCRLCVVAQSRAREKARKYHAQWRRDNPVVPTLFRE